MLAKGALINIYHSPFQQEYIEHFAGKFKCFLHPMCLPVKFRDLGLERKPKTQVLFVGDYSKEKGYRNMVEWLKRHRRCKIYHYGGGFPKKHHRMVEMGMVSQSKLVEVYNTFSTLIFLPKYPQACSRIIAEAYLCKVPHIHGNGKDGFTSYGWTYNDYDVVRERLVNGHKILWDKIEETLNA